MKKIAILLAIFLPLWAVAQIDSPRGELVYSCLSTINDMAITDDGDTVYKVGLFIDHSFSGQIFFGMRNLQLGLFGGYSTGSSLVEDYRANEWQNLSAGIMARKSFDYGEIKIGAGYFHQDVRDYGYSEEDFYFDDSLTCSGILLPVDIIFSHQGRLVPKIEVNFQSKFNWTEKFSESYLNHKQISFNSDVSLFRIGVPVPEIYFSPMVGVQWSDLAKTPIYKVGGIISSNNRVRADILSFGYFFERSIYGTEGLFVSVNVLGLINAWE